MSDPHTTSHTSISEAKSFGAFRGEVSSRYCTRNDYCPPDELKSHWTYFFLLNLNEECDSLPNSDVALLSCTFLSGCGTTLVETLTQQMSANACGSTQRAKAFYSLLNEVHREVYVEYTYIGETPTSDVDEN